VIIEGILDAGRYGEMLRTLTEEHLGTTVHYYFDIPFDETVARHANRHWAHEVPTETMRSWYRPGDLLPGLDQRVIDEGSTLDETVTRILSDLGVQAAASPPGEPEKPGHESARRRPCATAVAHDQAKRPGDVTTPNARSVANRTPPTPTELTFTHPRRPG
jgi:hypothetical protein